MKTVIHDLGEAYTSLLEGKCDHVIQADGRYAPCQGCFGCWTKHPAQCYLKDKLQMICRLIGRSDDLVIITENCYGAYSPAVKNVLDRSIGGSTPFSTYRGWQMHHALRYGKKRSLTVYTYGHMTPGEEETFRFLTQRNAVNFGYRTFAFHILETPGELEGMEL